MAGPEPSGLPVYGHVVTICPSLEHKVGLAVKGSRAIGWVLVLLGGALTFVTVITLAVTIGIGSISQPDLLTVSVLCAVFFGLAAVGFVALRRPDPTVALLSRDHLFVITDETLDFPAEEGREAESWPLRETTSLMAGGRNGPLILTCPGFRARNYPGLAMEEGADRVDARIKGAQRALERRRR